MMKKIVLIILILVVSGCANLKTPKETNVAVSYLLDQIQIAINEIDKQTKGTSLPPFKSAEVKLTTKANITDEGSGTLVLSGGASKSSTNTNTITLELVPNSDKQTLTESNTGLDIANYVIAAVTAVDDKNFLKLKTLTVEAGLQVNRKKNGGIEVELVGVTLKGGRSSEGDNSHNLKLIFGQSE